MLEQVGSKRHRSDSDITSVTTESECYDQTKVVGAIIRNFEKKNVSKEHKEFAKAFAKRISNFRPSIRNNIIGRLYGFVELTSHSKGRTDLMNRLDQWENEFGNSENTRRNHLN